MKRKRVDKGSFYYKFDIFGRIYKVQELGMLENKYDFFIGNYFRTKAQTEKARKEYLNES